LQRSYDRNDYNGLDTKLNGYDSEKHITFKNSKQTALWDDPEEDGPARYCKSARRKERAWNESKQKDCGKKNRLKTCIKQK
jgi:hypothetical protein